MFEQVCPRWMGIDFTWWKDLGIGYIQGTRFSAYNYFVNIAKHINDAHQISFYHSDHPNGITSAVIKTV